MRLALIGGFGSQPDEGMRKITGQLESMARQEHEVMAVRAEDFCRGRAWQPLRRFRPACLHYVTGPTVFSLIALKFHKLTLRDSPTTVATGLRPYLGKAGRHLLPLLAPDYYLAQSRRWQRVFAAAGSRTIDFPNGVDTSRFLPPTPEQRRALKAQWGLPLDRPVVLHVGHVRENRNLDNLIEAQRSGRYQVWIVGSESESQPGRYRTRLEAAGCRFHTQFVSAIEQVYQAADVYVFTVKAVPEGKFPAYLFQVGSIDLPLSILEAMACALPVVSTRHDAVEHFIGAVSGLRYFDGSATNCLRQLDALNGAGVATRATAERFDLARVREQLAAFYNSLAAHRRA